MKKYGLNVYTKYIAEVKRKHGVLMHEVPNKMGVPKRGYAEFPEEKVMGIMEALGYFGIISSM